MQKLSHLQTPSAAAGDSGSVLAGVLALAIIMAIAAMGYVQLAASSANNQTRTLRESEAFHAAESGVHMGALWINGKDNCERVLELFRGYEIDDIVPGYRLNGFDVRVDVLRTASGMQIRSTAFSRGALGYDKVITQDARRDIIVPFDTAAFDYAIICGGAFDFNGCGSISDGAWLHANGAVDIGGNASANLEITSATEISMGNKTVDGSLAAPELDIHRRAVITGGAELADVPPVTIPDIDLWPWYDVARANGEVYDGLSLGSSYAPKGRVLWVDGDVELWGGPGTTFDGTLIATGNIHIGGQVAVTAPEAGFAAASSGGDITVATSGQIDGLIYAATGNYSQTANGRLQGQLIVKGDIKKGGSSDIVAYKKCVPSVPGNGSEGGADLVAGTWREENVVSK